jgi:ribonuclease Z
LFDCGEGTQHQIFKLNAFKTEQTSHNQLKAEYTVASIKFGRVDKIFITHMHGDHVYGLPGLLCTLAQNTLPDKIIDIYGPKNLGQFLRHALSLTCSRLGCKYRVNTLLLPHETNEYSDLHPDELPETFIHQTNDSYWSVYSDNSVSVIAASIKHSIPSLGYIIQETDTPGTLMIEKLDPIIELHKDLISQLGYKNPKKILGDIKSGKDITLPNNITIHASDYVLPPRPGRKIVILGDTYDATSLVTLSQNADLIIHEATNCYIPLEVAPKSDINETFESVLATSREHGHSTPQVAGTFAKLSNANALVLNHFSSRYKGDDSEQTRKIMEYIKKCAVDTFGNQNVFTARDFLSVTVPRKCRDS